MEPVTITTLEQLAQVQPGELTMYRYSLAPQREDEFGYFRDAYVRDLEAGELETLDISDFEGAMDLADGVEFARGFDAEGNAIKVYRESL